MKTRITALDDNCVELTNDDGTRTFWCPLHGGYVREITQERPGTLGHQVCDYLAHSGNTLHVSDPANLLPTIRREYRRLKTREV